MRLPSVGFVSSFSPVPGQNSFFISPSAQVSKGYEFESDTDTETIPKLVKYMYDNRENDDISFATLVEQVTQQLVRTHCSTLHTTTQK